MQLIHKTKPSEVDLADWGLEVLEQFRGRNSEWLVDARSVLPRTVFHFLCRAPRSLPSYIAALVDAKAGSPLSC